MRGISLAFVLFVGVVGGACAAEGGNDEQPKSGGSQSATQQPSQRTLSQPQAPATTNAPSEPRQPAVFGLALKRVEVERAEDGGGNTIVAKDPIALDVRADQWQGRALDPVLYVGQLHLHSYSFVNKETMRFVLADASLLVAGSEVAVQYGDDTSSRVIVTASLEVPR